MELDWFARDEFDLITIGWTFLADPAWLTKDFEVRFDEIKTFTLEYMDALYGTINERKHNWKIDKKLLKFRTQTFA